jgi:hypothetical protein
MHTKKKINAARMPCLLVEQPVFFGLYRSFFFWLKHIWKLGFLQFYYYYCKKSQMESDIEPVSYMLEIKPGNSLDLVSYEHVNPHYCRVLSVGTCLRLQCIVIGEKSSAPGRCLAKYILCAVWFTKCNAKGNDNGLHLITVGNKFE